MKASFIFLSFLFGVSQARARGPLDALPQGPVRVSVSVDVNNKGSGISFSLFFGNPLVTHGSTHRTSAEYPGGWG